MSGCRHPHRAYTLPLELLFTCSLVVLDDLAATITPPGHRNTPGPTEHARPGDPPDTCSRPAGRPVTLRSSGGLWRARLRSGHLVAGCGRSGHEVGSRHLPAPFGPRPPVTTPGSTRKSIPATAVEIPYCFVKFRASTVGASAHRSGPRGPWPPSPSAIGARATRAISAGLPGGPGDPPYGLHIRGSEHPRRGTAASGQAGRRGVGSAGRRTPRHAQCEHPDRRQRPGDGQAPP